MNDPGRERRLVVSPTVDSRSDYQFAMNETESVRSDVEAVFRGLAVIGGVVSGGALLVALLLLALGGDPSPGLIMSAIMLAGAAGCRIIGRLTRE